MPWMHKLSSHCYPLMNVGLDRLEIQSQHCGVEKISCPCWELQPIVFWLQDSHKIIYLSMAERNENFTVRKLSDVWCVHCSAKGMSWHIDYLLMPDTNFLYKVYKVLWNYSVCSSTNMNMEQLQATNNALPSPFSFFGNIRKSINKTSQHLFLLGVYFWLCGML
jgi:hypothetical protein